MAAFKVPLKIDQGSTFDKLVTWKAGTNPAPVNLTGCTARAQIRADVDSATVLLSMTTENGRIQLGGAAGTIRILLSATETAALNFDSAVYDLEIVWPDGRVERKMRGSVVVSREVTR